MLPGRGAFQSYLMRAKFPRLSPSLDQSKSLRLHFRQARNILAVIMLYSVFAVTLVFGLSAALPTDAVLGSRTLENKINVQVGVRPEFLVNNMDDGPLKRKLESCSEGPFKTSDFSVSHRGAALEFPEHTEEGYRAARRQGAGIIECDVTFTKDKKLVCRHSQYVDSLCI